MRADAKSAGKAATKKVGEQVAQEIARGIIPGTVEEVLRESTKLTKTMGRKLITEFISSGGCTKTFYEKISLRVLNEGVEAFLKGSTSKKLVSELTQKAAKAGAEEEFKKHCYKLIAKDVCFAFVEGGVRSQIPRENASSGYIFE